MNLLDYFLYLALLFLYFALLLLGIVGGGKIFYDILMEPMPGYYDASSGH